MFSSHPLASRGSGLRTAPPAHSKGPGCILFALRCLYLAGRLAGPSLRRLPGGGHGRGFPFLQRLLPDRSGPQRPPSAHRHVGSLITNST